MIQVISESLRMASIISYTFREAVVDVEYNGKKPYLLSNNFARQLQKHIYFFTVTNSSLLCNYVD